MNVLLIEPYDMGSHAVWARGLQQHSTHTIEPGGHLFSRKPAHLPLSTWHQTRFTLRLDQLRLGAGVQRGGFQLGLSPR